MSIASVKCCLWILKSLQSTHFSRFVGWIGVLWTLEECARPIRLDAVTNWKRVLGFPKSLLLRQNKEALAMVRKTNVVG